MRNPSEINIKINKQSNYEERMRNRENSSPRTEDKLQTIINTEKIIKFVQKGNFLLKLRE